MPRESNAETPARNRPAAPAMPAPDDTPKPPLEQALSIERVRWRREMMRRDLCFLLVLAALLGGGAWLARRLLDQAGAERRAVHQALQNILAQSAAASAPAADEAPEALTDLPPVSGSTPADPPASRESMPDLRGQIVALESQNQALTKRLDTQRAETQALLARNEAELRDLRARLDEVQRRAAQAPPPERPPPAPVLPPAPVPAPPAPLDTAAACTTLTVRISNGVPMRLPIPPP